jgi:hypothetical protein
VEQGGRISPIVAVLVGGFGFGVSVLVWEYAVVAEVFALNALFGGLLLVLALEYDARPDRGWLLWLLGLLSGLALAHHQTIVLIAPSLAILAFAALARAQAHRVRDLAIGIALGLVGLLPYVYLPLAAAADPAVNFGDPVTLERFIAVVTREAYGTVTLTVTDIEGSRLENMLNAVAESFWSLGPVVCLLAALGASRLVRARPRVAFAMLLAFLLPAPVFAGYANPDLSNQLAHGVIERFFILPSIAVAVLAAVGSGWLVGQTRRLSSSEPIATGPLRRTMLAGLTAAMMIVAVLVPILLRFGAVDRSGDTVSRDYGRALLEGLPPNAILLMRGDLNYSAVVYLQVVEQERPDVVALDIELLKASEEVRRQRRAHPDVEIPFAAYDEGAKASMAELVAANIDDRPVYMVGSLKETDSFSPFHQRRAGLATRIDRPTVSGDNWTPVREDPSLVTRLEFPRLPLPQGSWEYQIGRAYGRAAFDLAYVLDDGTQPEVAAFWYRRAIEYDPDLAGAYKNLGLVLDRLGDADGVIAVWSKYLELNPTDPQADAMQTRVEQLLESR